MKYAIFFYYEKKGICIVNNTFSDIFNRGGTENPSLFENQNQNGFYQIHLESCTSVLYIAFYNRFLLMSNSVEAKYLNCKLLCSMLGEVDKLF